jgi:hypothetical protein
VGRTPKLFISLLEGITMSTTEPKTSSKIKRISNKKLLNILEIALASEHYIESRPYLCVAVDWLYRENVISYEDSRTVQAIIERRINKLLPNPNEHSTNAASTLIGRLYANDVITTVCYNRENLQKYREWYAVWISELRAAIEARSKRP